MSSKEQMITYFEEALEKNNLSKEITKKIKYKIEFLKNGGLNETPQAKFFDGVTWK